MKALKKFWWRVRFVFWMCRYPGMYDLDHMRTYWKVGDKAYDWSGNGEVSPQDTASEEISYWYE